MPVKFTNSMKREVTPLVQLSSTAMPYVFYTVEAWKTIEYLVAKCDKEVGWFGLVDEYSNGNYCVTEILIPKQEVSGATVDIEANAVSELVNRLMDEGKDPGKLRYHGHSHVNMQVMPSGTDQQHLEEYMEDCDWFIRGIYNKKGDSKVDVFDKRQQCVFQCVDTEILENLQDDAFYAALDAQLKAQVSQRTYARPSYYQHSKDLPPGALTDQRYKPENWRAQVHYFDDSLDDEGLDDVFPNDLVYQEALKDPFYKGKA